MEKANSLIVRELIRKTYTPTVSKLNHTVVYHFFFPDYFGVPLTGVVVVGAWGVGIPMFLNQYQKAF